MIFWDAFQYKLVYGSVKLSLHTRLSCLMDHVLEIISLYKSPFGWKWKFSAHLVLTGIAGACLICPSSLCRGVVLKLHVLFWLNYQLSPGWYFTFAFRDSKWPKKKAIPWGFLWIINNGCVNIDILFQSLASFLWKVWYFIIEKKHLTPLSHGHIVKLELPKNSSEKDLSKSPNSGRT